MSQFSKNPLTHSIEAAQSAMSAAGAGPRIKQKASTFMYANNGPAEIAARISGVKSGGRKTDDATYFTNNEGISWPDAAHSKNVGGIPVISDTFLLEKQQTFNRGKTLERMVHPAGSGAFGYFECTKDMSHLTKAGLYTKPGKQTPVLMRFSTVTFGREFPDSGRNPRGFATKHYTEEGNYDVVGLQDFSLILKPIFFCRDPIQGPDVIRSQQRNPTNFLLDYYSLINFDGALRSDANTGGTPHYTPNSFVHEFRPNAAETPYAVPDNVVSRQAHSYSEGTTNSRGSSTRAS